MQRSSLAADVLDVIAECLGPQCRFKLGRSRGIPPAVCPSITTSWVDRTAKTWDENGQCFINSSLGLRITITDICMGPDAAENFDFVLEDAAAVCFDDEVDAIESCMQCYDFEQIRQDNKLMRIAYESTTYDVESDGGGYSAYIEMGIVAAECCP